MLVNRRERGVTLVELLIAISIVGFLIMLAEPSYAKWVKSQQTRVATEAILNGIQMARTEAVRNNGQARFVLCELPSSSWEVLAASATAPAPSASVVCGAGSKAGAGDVRVQERSGKEGSASAMVSVTPSGAAIVTFNSLGRVVANADFSSSITAVDVDPTGDRPLKVTIGLGGSVRMCDPSPRLSSTDPRHC